MSLEQYAVGFEQPGEEQGHLPSQHVSKGVKRCTGGALGDTDRGQLVDRKLSFGCQPADIQEQAVR